MNNLEKLWINLKLMILMKIQDMVKESIENLHDKVQLEQNRVFNNV